MRTIAVITLLAGAQLVNQAPPIPRYEVKRVSTGSSEVRLLPLDTAPRHVAAVSVHNVHSSYG